MLEMSMLPERQVRLLDEIMHFEEQFEKRKDNTTVMPTIRNKK